MRKNDTSWELLFKEYNILEKIKKDNYFIITSEQINKYREARLMTKFDHFKDLPAIFKENFLTILPITRGSYIISAMKIYQNVKYEMNDIIEIGKPKNILSIDTENIYSEAAALNCTYTTGIINHLCDERVLPTLSGRMASSHFKFNVDLMDFMKVKALNIEVNNSQIEIDGGYESENFLILIEAKNVKVEDFLIRQLFYPYRLWHNKINKKIVPVLMTYQNGIYSFFVYRFKDIFNYNSIELQIQKHYKIIS